MDEDRRAQLDREIDRQLHTARWAPRVNISAADRAARGPAGARHRAGPGRLGNPGADRPAERLARPRLVAATPPPSRGGRQPKILFATQAGIRPPHFVLFSTGFLEAGYRRFIERRLREEFGFEGSPLRVSLRLRERQAGRRSGLSSTGLASTGK